MFGVNFGIENSSCELPSGFRLDQLKSVQKPKDHRIPHDRITATGSFNALHTLPVISCRLFYEKSGCPLFIYFRCICLIETCCSIYSNVVWCLFLNCSKFHSCLKLAKRESLATKTKTSAVKQSTTNCHLYCVVVIFFLYIFKCCM